MAWLTAFGNDEIDSFGSHEFDIGARGVEVRVVRDHVALLAHHSEQNAFGGAALMSWNHMAIAENILNGLAKSVEALASSVTLVAFHDRRPLVRGHGPGAGIGQQVNQHVGGGKQEQIVVSSAEKLFPLRARGPPDRLNALDAKRLDDGARHDGSARARNLPTLRR